MRPGSIYCQRAFDIYWWDPVSYRNVNIFFMSSNFNCYSPSPWYLRWGTGAQRALAGPGVDISPGLHSSNFLNLEIDSFPLNIFKLDPFIDLPVVFIKLRLKTMSFHVVLPFTFYLFLCFRISSLQNVIQHVFLIYPLLSFPPHDPLMRYICQFPRIS